MNKSLALGLCLLLAACAPSADIVSLAAAQTQAAWTPIPSQTPLATYTPYPTQTPALTYTPEPTRVVVQTKTVTRTVVETAVPILCKDRPKTINYSGNGSVSASLKAWLEDTEGSVDTAKWEAIWNNTRTAVHRLAGKFLWVYVVYFKDPATVFETDRTFDVTRQCWLD